MIRHRSNIFALTVVASLFVYSCTDALVDSTDESAPDAGNDSASAEDVSDHDVAKASKNEDAGDANDVDSDVPLCTPDWCSTPLPALDGGALTLMSVSTASEGNAWAVSAEGLILHWNGTEWSLASNASVRLNAVWVEPEGGVWVVGENGTILRSSDGSSWTTIPSGTTSELRALCEGTRDEQHPRNLWLIGASGIILHWKGDLDEDNDPIWISKNVGDYPEDYTIDLNAVSCNDHGVWAAGILNQSFWDRFGAVFYNDGNEWGEMTTLPQELSRDKIFHSIWVSNEIDFFVAADEILFRSLSEPQGDLQWTALLFNNFTEFPDLNPRKMSVWGTNGNDVWLAAQHGRIFHWDGTKFKTTATARGGRLLQSNLHSISGSSAEDVWVVGDDVALHRNTQH